MKLLEEMKRRRLFFDGGTGSLLQAQGLRAGELPEMWNLTRPEVLIRLHRDYLEAGADIIKTNTFGANSLKFKGLPWDPAEGERRPEHCCAAEVIEAGVKNAREAAKQAGKGFVALDLGPTGKLLEPLGDLPFEQAVELYKEAVRAGRRAGADLILIETMGDSYELKAAVLAAKEEGQGLPVFATVIFDEKGKLLTGGNVESTVALLEGLRVDALGVNCGLGPVQMKGIVEELLRVSSLPVIVNPNAGLPRSENGVTFYDVGAEAFAGVMEEFARNGACILGGCCGTTPEHIQRTAARCREIPVREPEKKRRTVVSSCSQAVVFDRETVIIGERINPTGKPKFKQALRERNLEYILKEAVAQEDSGAHVLDVNVGLPEIDEPSMMEEVVRELQAVTTLPLQIDTSNPQAMERALRIYNGKPLINSVNGKEEVMEAVFPLAAKYGGTVIALCLDEDGIPDTAAGRIRVAEKIARRAAAYGIGMEDLVFDGLCMTVSSDSRGALTTLETLRGIRRELGGKTVLGVSNISFGLPQREIINSAFFTMAMEAGLDGAIINPNSEAMMRAYYSFNALMDRDPQCSRYIRIYGGRTDSLGETLKRRETGQEGEAGSLSQAIERGLKEAAAQAVAALLKEKEALEVINQEMIPALDRVGKGFEAGTVFLPQLLMSAEAAKAAFEVIKDRMAGLGQAQEKKGRIILATVKGDIHDIGKNIVKVLLENYSYEVIDLGRDVPPERVLEAALAENAPLVGLSALMTTTVPSMEETIKLLRRKAPGVRIMVGGAVLTQDYAAAIGADAYCRDAMASVHYAQSVFGKE